MLKQISEKSISILMLHLYVSPKTSVEVTKCEMWQQNAALYLGFIIMILSFSIILLLLFLSIKSKPFY